MSKGLAGYMRRDLGYGSNRVVSDIMMFILWLGSQNSKSKVRSKMYVDSESSKYLEKTKVEKARMENEKG